MIDFASLSFTDLVGYDFSTLDAEGLTAYQGELRTRFEAIKQVITDGGAPTVAQAREATELAARYSEIDAAQAALDDAEPASEEALAALGELSLDEVAVGEDAEEGTEEDAESGETTDEAGTQSGTEPAEVAEVAEPVAAAIKPKATPKKKSAAYAVAPRKTAVAALAGARPPVPGANVESMVTITAAADTQFGTGSEISLADLGEAARHRLASLPEPTGDGQSEDWRKFAVGNVTTPFPEDLIIPDGASIGQAEKVLAHAADETRLPGESLVASAGWGAPSEQLYDLCGGEVLDGILSIAEVQVSRGGFKHTTGIDFSTVFAATGVGGIQTETQAIAGTAKNSFEVPTPTFVDERLDAVYTNIRVPILLEVGYPEMTTSVMTKSLIAHAYKVNASVLTRLIAIAGAATDITPDFASLTGELLMGLDLLAEQTRQKWRLGVNASLVVILPVWARTAIRTDLGLRTGRDVEAVTDSEIMAHFAARNLAVQFVWGWQELAGTELTLPATVESLLYPASAVVKGTSNVINLSAVYDAASLATNIYTGMFMEQGLLVAKMCQEVRRVVVPVTGAFTGKTGAASL